MFGKRHQNVEVRADDVASKCFHFSVCVCLSAGFEDKEGWHGKPLGDKTDATIAAIMDNVVNKEKHGLCPQTPAVDVPAVPFGGAKLSEPPSYKIGDMVRAVTARKHCHFALLH